MTIKNQIRVALGYFLLASIFGFVLRSFLLADIPLNYRFIVHTHSHIALLGWVYLALTALLYGTFVQTSATDKMYPKIFWFTQSTLAGMLFTFPFQGYAPLSIVFSTLFLFASYWFFWFLTRHAKPEFKKRNSYKCIKAALWFMVLSSIGPWSLGLIMNTLGPESVWYRISIYFYLHFQYNGWMGLALFGLFLYVLEQKQIGFSKSTFRKFFRGIVLAVVLSFFLSILFMDPPRVFNYLGGLGGLLQLGAFGILLKMLPELYKRPDVGLRPFQKTVLKIFISFTILKMLLQLVSSIPYFADLAATLPDFVIGYLHWTFLGVVTVGLFFFVDHFKLIQIPKKAHGLYLFGFFVTELLIFYKGIAAWQDFQLFKGYFAALAMGSFLIPLGLILIFLDDLSNKYRA